MVLPRPLLPTLAYGLYACETVENYGWALIDAMLHNLMSQ